MTVKWSHHQVPLWQFCGQCTLFFIIPINLGWVLSTVILIFFAAFEGVLSILILLAQDRVAAVTSTSRPCTRFVVVGTSASLSPLTPVLFGANADAAVIIVLVFLHSCFLEPEIIQSICKCYKISIWKKICARSQPLFSIWFFRFVLNTFFCILTRMPKTGLAFKFSVFFFFSQQT